jgi:hypothetical protein
VFAFTSEEYTGVHFFGYGEGYTNADTKLSNANFMREPLKPTINGVSIVPITEVCMAGNVVVEIESGSSE